jgi:hypothetical protein
MKPQGKAQCGELLVETKLDTHLKRGWEGVLPRYAKIETIDTYWVQFKETGNVSPKEDARRPYVSR